MALSTQSTSSMGSNSRLWMACLLSVLLVLLSGCNALNTVTNMATGGGAGTVASLWSDVPPLDGATKADLQLPVFAQVIIRAMAQGKMDFIAYTSTKTAKEVGEFYTVDLMKAQGWTQQMTPCTTSESSGQSFTICAFGKQTNGKQEIVALVAAPDTATKLTQIYYVRIDTSSTPVPTQ